MTERRYPFPFIAGVFFVLAGLAPLRAIRDFDYYWHLATGRWIGENRGLPRFDPFGAATDAIPWINGEWLFQILIYPLHLATGPHGVVVMRSLLIGAIFTFALVVARRESGSTGIAMAIVVVCWYGAVPALGERPATPATVLVVAAVVLSLRDPSWRRITIYWALTVVWINMHPSALLAPVIAGLAAVGRLGVAEGRQRDVMLRGAAHASGSFAALLINPYGLDAILAPNRLVHWVMTGPFLNREWQPTSPLHHPAVYALIAVAAITFLASREKRRHLTHALLLVFFSILAIRFLRNHGFFYSVYPLLFAPLLPRIHSLVISRVAGIAAFIGMLVIPLTRDLRSGIDERMIPVISTERLVESGAGGNIFASGHYGGYLIWTFYPERRVVNDGRNELHKTFTHEYAEARGDSRAWQRLVDKYAITIAVVDYELPVPVFDPETGERKLVPSSHVFFPRTRWALIAWDEAAMVFVRREADHGIEIPRWELRDPPFDEASMVKR